MTRILRNAGLLVLLLAVAAPALAQRHPGYTDNSIRLRFGLFEPDGDSDYWKFGELDDPNVPVFTGSADDFDDLLAGVEYIRYIGPRTGVMFSVSGYGSEQSQAYVFFEDQFGGDIVHRTRLDIGSLTAGILFNLLPRHRRLVPYVGVGGGFYAWELEESGDFIDFNTTPLSIFRGRFTDDGATLGWYWQAGLRVGLSRAWSFFGEIRGHEADDNLSGDFAGFGQLDLSGREISGGFWWDF